MLGVVFFKYMLYRISVPFYFSRFINPKGRIPRVYPWMNGNSPEGRRARLEMWKGATDLSVGFPLGEQAK